MKRLDFEEIRCRADVIRIKRRFGKVYGWLPARLCTPSCNYRRLICGWVGAAAAWSWANLERYPGNLVLFILVSLQTSGF